MNDQNLLKITLKRLKLTYKEAAVLLGLAEISINQYARGVRSIPAAIWRGLLEHEARIAERQTGIAEMVERLNDQKAEKARERRLKAGNRPIGRPRAGDDDLFSLEPDDEPPKRPVGRPPKRRRRSPAAGGGSSEKSSDK